MKTWQMIKELTENPNKEFISKQLTPRRAYVKRGVLSIVIDETGKAAVDTGLDRDWEEVKKPATFMELLEKIKTNGEVFLNFEYEEIELYDCGLSDILQDLAKTYPDSTLVDILLNGKWYIED